MSRRAHGARIERVAVPRRIAYVTLYDFTAVPARVPTVANLAGIAPALPTSS
jgi:hypothetical protein